MKWRKMAQLTGITATATGMVNDPKIPKRSDTVARAISPMILPMENDPFSTGTQTALPKPVRTLSSR